ncbi:MAG: hypothetical protein ACO3QC_11700 [Phycisphaerales bacterium]
MTTLPIPASTGTCPACGETLHTAQGLARHNLHASVGERSYRVPTHTFVHLAKTERLPMPRAA